MHKLLCRVAPVGMALGLWLVGSAFVGTNPARSLDNMEVTKNEACLSRSTPTLLSSCTQNPNQPCNGSCSGNLRYESFCGPSDTSGSLQCHNFIGTVFQQNYEGGCQITMVGTGRNIQVACQCGTGELVGKPFQTDGVVCGFDV